MVTAGQQIAERANASAKSVWADLIYNVKAYGAVEGEDCTAAFQSAFNAAVLTGGEVWVTGKGPYFISSELFIKPLVDQTEPGSGAFIHAADTRKVRLCSPSRAIIKATAAMDNMIHFVFNEDVENGIAPFYSEVVGIQFDGNSLATAAILAEWTMHVTIEKCVFVNIPNGIQTALVQGYGVAEIKSNVFLCTQNCIVVQSGDNIIQHNDFYPGNVGVYVGPWGGNTSIESNIFSRDTSMVSNATPLYGVKLMGSDSGDGAKEVRDVDIDFNEFSGIDYGVYGSGHTTLKNVYNCRISHNHVTTGGINNSVLAFLFYCQDINISHNHIGGKSYADIKQVVELQHCDRIVLVYNEVYNCTDNAYELTTCTDCIIENEAAFDIGKSSTANGFVSLTDCTGTNVNNNRVKQSSAAYAQNGVVEAGTSDNTIADYNIFTGIGAEYFKVGASSFMKSRLHGTAAPSTGTWLQGAANERPNPAASGFIGDVCVTGGTPGTWKTFGAISS